MSVWQAFSMLNRLEVWLALPLLLSLLIRNLTLLSKTISWIGVLMLTLHLLTIPESLILQWLTGSNWQQIRHPVSQALLWSVAYTGFFLLRGERGRWKLTIIMAPILLILLTLNSPGAALAILLLIIVYGIFHFQSDALPLLIQQIVIIILFGLTIFGFSRLLQPVSGSSHFEQQVVTNLRQDFPDWAILLALPGEGGSVTPRDFGRPPALTSRQIYQLEVTRPGTYYLAENYSRTITDSGWDFSDPTEQQRDLTTHIEMPNEPSNSGLEEGIRINLVMNMGYQTKIPRPRMNGFLVSELSSQYEPLLLEGSSAKTELPTSIQLSEMIPPDSSISFILYPETPNKFDVPNQTQPLEPTKVVNQINTPPDQRVHQLLGLPNRGDFNQNRAQLAAFLTEHTSYSLDVEPIPENSHPLSGFFATGLGYCLHYATAAALYFDNLGYPVRFVDGFVISVSYLDLGRPVSITGKHSHTWVEVLDEYGYWRIAELTPGEGLLTTQSASFSARTSPSPLDQEPENDQETNFRPWILSLLGVVLLGVLGVILTFLNQKQRRWIRLMIRISTRAGMGTKPSSMLLDESAPTQDQQIWNQQLRRWYGYPTPAVQNAELQWLRHRLKNQSFKST